MIEWQTPVFDRTAADAAARADKCFFTPALLNRIEGNTAYLAQLAGITVPPRTWSSTDFLTASEMRRILDNLARVRTALKADSVGQIPQLPATGWWDVNNIEKTQALLMDSWQKEQQSVSYAGERYAGETIGVI